MLKNEQIIEILNEWNFWTQKPQVGVIRPRYLDLLRKYLQTDEIIALSGVRRSGKSTLLLQLINYLLTKKKVSSEQILYVNFEEPKFFDFLNLKLLDQILQAYFEIINVKQDFFYLFLDEVQNVPAWEQWVRACYDKKIRVKIFVTGSSSQLLSSEFSTLLTGRHLDITVYPLSFREYLSFHNINFKNKFDFIKQKEATIQLSRQFIQEGGFPKPVLTQDKNIQSSLLKQYYEDIVLHDAAVRYKVKEIDKLKSLGYFYANNFSSLISFNKTKGYLSNNISLDSVERFSQYLVNAFLFFLVPIFSYSFASQIKSNKKVYIIDNGLRQAVAFQFSKDWGRYLENAVFLELKKQGQEIFYFAKDQEVDFLIKHGRRIIQAINVCYNFDVPQTKEREIRSLTKAMQEFNLPEGLIITDQTGDQISLDNKKSIQVLPFWRWALEG